MNQKTLLEIENLKTHFNTDRGKVTAVDNVSFHIKEGEILGIVGESGSGKSVTIKSILRLFDEKKLANYEGNILFNGENIFNLSETKMRDIRGNKISMIFQDPLSSLDPLYTIGNQIVEAIMLHQNLSKKKSYEKAIELLKLTGIPDPEKRVNNFPHELSGGMKQRAMIAIALSCQPSILIADEPTTALDVTTQAQILKLITDLNKEFQMSVIFISHDLDVISEICDRVAVMYLGQIVEETNVEKVFSTPLHPYTKGLLKAIPQIDGERANCLHVIEGSMPSLQVVQHGCKFASRCSFADQKCKEQQPDFKKSNFDSKHKVRCWHYEEIALKEE